MRQGKCLYQNTKFCNNKQKTEGKNNKLRFKKNLESDVTCLLGMHIFRGFEKVKNDDMNERKIVCSFSVFIRFANRTCNFLYQK